MAGGRGPLSERVTRILESEAPTSPAVRPWTRAGLFALLGLTAVFAPALAPPALLGPAVADAAEVAAVPVEPGPVATADAPEAVFAGVRRGSEPAVAPGIDEGITGGIAEGVAEGMAAALADGAWELEALEALDALGPEVWSPAVLELSKADIERYEAQAQELARKHRRFSHADLERLQQAAREAAEKARPSPAEIEKLRAELRALAERHQPSRAQLDLLREQARALALETRQRAQRDSERLRLRSSEALVRELAAQERRLEAELERIRALRAEANRRHTERDESDGEDGEDPEPPRP